MIADTNSRGNHSFQYGSDEQVYKHNNSRNNIRLRKLDAYYVIKFIQDIDEYQSKYNCRLSVASLLSSRVRDELCYTQALDEEDLYNLSSRRIIKILLKEIRPRSRSAFLRALDDCMDFSLPSGYVPSNLNPIPFYRAVISYYRRVKKIFAYLSYENDSNVPRMSKLVDLFASQIDIEYTYRICEILEANNFEDFLDSFHDIIRQEYDCFKQLEQVQQALVSRPDQVLPIIASETVPIKIELASQEHNDSPVQVTSSQLGFDQPSPRLMLASDDSHDHIIPEAKQLVEFPTRFYTNSSRTKLSGKPSNTSRCRFILQHGKYLKLNDSFGMEQLYPFNTVCPHLYKQRLKAPTASLSINYIHNNNYSYIV